MKEYRPDSWVIVKLPSNYGYKVLGGWSGSYLQGDSWRVNSGITHIEREGGDYLIHGYSSPVYMYTADLEGRSICQYIKLIYVCMYSIRLGFWLEN